MNLKTAHALTAHPKTRVMTAVAEILVFLALLAPATWFGGPLAATMVVLPFALWPGVCTKGDSMLDCAFAAVILLLIACMYDQPGNAWFENSADVAPWIVLARVDLSVLAFLMRPRRDIPTEVGS